MPKPVICIGAALVDELFYATDPLLLRTTNNVHVKRSAGGVSRNIAHQLSLLGVPTQLITVIGTDADGVWLKHICEDAGIKLDASLTVPGTGKYTGIINDDGSLFTALLSNALVHLITPQYLTVHKSLLSTASYLLVDANLIPETIEWLIEFSNESGIPLIIEPVSVPPAKKLAHINLKGLYLITPNEDELPAICNSSATTTEEQIKELLERGVQNIWLHKGAEGSAFYSDGTHVTLHAPEAKVVDCTGAGDGSVTGYLLGKFLGKNEADCLKIGHTLAAEILQVNGAIAKHIHQEDLLNLVPKYYND